MITFLMVHEFIFVHKKVLTCFSCTSLYILLACYIITFWHYRIMDIKILVFLTVRLVTLLLRKVVTVSLVIHNLIFLFGNSSVQL